MRQATAAGCLQGGAALLPAHAAPPRRSDLRCLAGWRPACRQVKSAEAEGDLPPFDFERKARLRQGRAGRRGAAADLEEGCSWGCCAGAGRAGAANPAPRVAALPWPPLHPGGRQDPAAKVPALGGALRGRRGRCARVCMRWGTGRAPRPGQRRLLAPHPRPPPSPPLAPPNPPHRPQTLTARCRAARSAACCRPTCGTRRRAAWPRRACPSTSAWSWPSTRRTCCPSRSRPRAWR